ncbi:MAG: efflux transporter outer membrane subunit [Pseudomonadota bacterium]
MNILTPLATCATMLLSACGAVGPDFTPPQAELPPSFVAGQTARLTTPETQMWWRDFKDPMLNDLIASGLASNLDIRTSLARIAQAEASLRGTGVNAQLSGNLTNDNIRTGGDGISTTTSSTTELSGSYVIDLFGGIRREREEAVANLKKAGFDLGDARLAFVLSIVSNYIDARFAQEAAALTRNTVTSRQNTLDLVRSKRAAGSSSELDVAQSEADLFSAEADLEGYISDFEMSAFAIATLLDTEAAPLLRRLQQGAAQPFAPAASRLGVPTDLLRSLPSIRSAELGYAAEVANLGVQEANLLPSLTLSGNLSISDTDTWSFGPTVSLPVFGQGALRAQRDAQIAAVEEAEIAWRSTVRSAVEDVEKNAAALVRSQRQIEHLRRAVTASDLSLELNRANFEAGQSSLFELLDAERTTTSQRLSLASEVRAAATEWSSLQIALGRGWRIPPEVR